MHRLAVSFSGSRRWLGGNLPLSLGRRWCSDLRATQFAQVAPMLLLQQAIAQYPDLRKTEVEGKQCNALGDEAQASVPLGRAVLSKSEFSALCRLCFVDNVDEAVKRLAVAGLLVQLADGAVHLRPAQLLHDSMEIEMETSAVAHEELEPLHRAAERCFAAAVERERALRLQLAPALHRAAKRRRIVWGSALVFAGTQLAVIARLTYFDLDWDIMEPVSYFLCTGTSLAFFLLYLMRYGREHSYTDFDRRFVPQYVRRFAPEDFPWDEYDAACGEVRRAGAHLAKVRQWMRRS